MNHDTVIVGGGRIGTLVHRLVPGSFVVARGETVPIARTTWTCVGEPDLPTAWDATASAARAGSILVQNGLLPPWLERHAGGAPLTRGVLYVAAPRRDGVGVAGGASVFFGPRAAEAVAAFRRAGLEARVAADAGDFGRVAAEKLAWTCILGVLGAVHAQPVGRIAEAHAERIRALAAELAPVLGEAHGVELDGSNLTTSVLAYCARIADWRAGLKCLAWRNGALLAEARRQGRVTPLHEDALGRAGIDVGSAAAEANALLYSPA